MRRVLGKHRGGVSFGGEQHTIVHADVQDPPDVIDESAEPVG